MNYTNDDLLGNCIAEISDPQQLSGIYQIAGRAVQRGDVYDDASMEGFLDSLNESLKNVFKGKSITIESDKGTTKIGEGELSYTQTPTTTTGAILPTTTGGFTDMLKNPVILGTIIGVPLLLILVSQQKKKGKKR